MTLFNCPLCTWPVTAKDLFMPEIRQVTDEGEEISLLRCSGCKTIIFDTGSTDDQEES